VASVSSRAGICLQSWARTKSCVGGCSSGGSSINTVGPVMEGFDRAESLRSGTGMSRVSLGSGDEVYGDSRVKVEIGLGLSVGEFVLSLDSIVVRG
jgi:hypothetical protein